MSRIFKDFDWKNGEFNTRQKQYLEVYAQNQIDLYLTGETDEKKAEKHLKAIYKQLGKKEPAIVWHDSPEAMVKSVRASVRDSVRDSVRSWEWSGSMSFYKFFSEEFEQNALEDWCLYSEQVTGGICSDEVAHLVRKPKRLVRNSAGRLHYDHDKAIEWNDGVGYYYLNGVQFDEKTWRTIVNEELTLETLGKITNADQRAVAVQMLRPDRLLKQVNANLIHTGEKGTELYEVPNFMDTGDTEYCMKMEHPSIKGKYYIEWVEPKVGEQKDADLAQAVAFGFTKEQYLEADEA